MERSVELWMGYSAHSQDIGFLGRRVGLSLALGAARFSRQIAVHGHRSVEYTFDLFPMAIMSPPLQDHLNAANSRHEGVAKPRGPCAFGAFSCVFPSGSARAIGFSPLGLATVFRTDRVLQFRLGATGGALMFDRRVPTSVSTSFNFTATLEAGVQLVSKSGRGVVFMYRFHHLSNAGTGYDNSALASHVLSIGARWRRD